LGGERGIRKEVKINLSRKREKVPGNENRRSVKSPKSPKSTTKGKESKSHGNTSALEGKTMH